MKNVLTSVVPAEGYGPAKFYGLVDCDALPTTPVELFHQLVDICRSTAPRLLPIFCPFQKETVWTSEGTTADQKSTSYLKGSLHRKIERLRDENYWSASFDTYIVGYCEQEEAYRTLQLHFAAQIVKEPHSRLLLCVTADAEFFSDTDIRLDQLASQVDKIALYGGGVLFPDHPHVIAAMGDLVQANLPLTTFCNTVVTKGLLPVKQSLSSIVHHPRIHPTDCLAVSPSGNLILVTPDRGLNKYGRSSVARWVDPDRRAPLLVTPVGLLPLTGLGPQKLWDLFAKEDLRGLLRHVPSPPHNLRIAGPWTWDNSTIVSSLMRSRLTRPTFTGPER